MSTKLHIGHLVSFSKQAEILLWSCFGIIFAIFDASLLHVNNNLYRLWEVRMDPLKFSESTELNMKYLLCAIVLIRTFTVHLYLGCYIIMMYPTLFEERPSLLIPWLIVKFVKGILTDVLAFAAGLYTCAVYKFSQPTCWEFILIEATINAPSVYFFTLVLSFYRDLRKRNRIRLFSAHLRDGKYRQRANELSRTSLSICEVKSSFSEKLISVSTIDTLIIFAHNSNGRSRSFDTLLSQMKENDERNEILSIYDDMPEDDTTLSVQNRTARLLNLTSKDIETARKERDKRLLDGKKEYKSMSSINSKVSTLSSKPKKLTDSVSVTSEEEIRSVMIEEYNSDSRFVCNPSIKSQINENTNGIYSQSSSCERSSVDSSSQITPDVSEKSTQLRDDDEFERNCAMTELYKNECAIFQSNYKEDGYTMAFLDNINKN